MRSNHSGSRPSLFKTLVSGDGGAFGTLQVTGNGYSPPMVADGPLPDGDGYGADGTGDGPLELLSEDFT